MNTINTPWTERWLPLMLLLVTLLFWAALMAWGLSAARLAPADTGTVAVVFPRGTPSHQMFHALQSAGGRLERTTWLDNIWVVYDENPDFVARLEAAGARGAYSAALFQPVSLAGCF